MMSCWLISRDWVVSQSLTQVEKISIDLFFFYGILIFQALFRTPHIANLVVAHRKNYAAGIIIIILPTL